MKNRTLILNDLTRMHEHKVSLEEMASKLQHFSMSYYESLNMLHEVTSKSLNEVSEELLKEPYWQDMKDKTDQKENTLNSEYGEILNNRKIQQKHFDEAIEESYYCVLDSRRRKEKQLRNLDKSLMEIFQ